MDLDALRIALDASPENIPLLLMVARLEEDRFALAEARACLDGTHPAIKAPPPIAIARTLLQAWVDGFEV